jgi:hypothetical protein
VPYQVVDLFFGEFVIEGWHLVPAFADDVEKFFVRFLLHVGRTKRADLQILAEHRVAFSRGSMASRAFSFVGIGSAVGERAGGN